jgi:hypothetical protein
MKGDASVDGFMRVFNLTKLETTPLNWLKAKVEILDRDGNLTVYENGIKSIELWVEDEPDAD